MNCVSDYDVLWETPSKNSAGSMPTGNGDIGLNVWAEADSDLFIYIGKTDSWDENCRLLKLGLLRINLTPNPFVAGMQFAQKLNLQDGEIIISANDVTLNIWVDANHPTAHIDIHGKQKITCKAEFIPLRTTPQQIFTEEQLDKIKMGLGELNGSHSEKGLVRAGASKTISPDIAFPARKEQEGAVVWCHRNQESIWKEELSHQGLKDFTNNAVDPLLYLTSGGMLSANGFVNDSDNIIRSVCSANQFNIELYLHTQQVMDIGDWLTSLEMLARDVKKIPSRLLKQEHCNWWKRFWERSYINLSGGDRKETATISSAWHLHRYTLACAARGNFPAKYNGSLFNVDGNNEIQNPSCDAAYSADYRGWGGCYWFQNQRQMYWPMLWAGDYDCMLPFFKMYSDALPFAKMMTAKWFHHDGAFFPETMYFWGSYNRSDYGEQPACDRQDMSNLENGHMKRYWQGGLELVCMMIAYYSHTQDDEFLKNILLPIAKEVIEFYNAHYGRDTYGKIVLEPAQALETLWDVKNPLPDVAGLYNVLNGLIHLPIDALSNSQRESYEKLLSELPPMPIKEKGGKRYLDACDENRGETRNLENIAMYAVFPYRIFGVGRPDLSMARDTFFKRPFTEHYRCWHNDNVFAAYLGLAQEAQKHLAERYTLCENYRFPTFYEKGDWVPDHDNGGVAQQAIQAMLIQTHEKEILLFPAFPKEWDVTFKLNAPMNTTIECKRTDGKIEYLRVTPSKRADDIMICES